MKFFALFIFALLCGAALAQNELKQTLDSFAADTTVIVIVVPSGGVPAGGISQVEFTDSTQITLGNERDLEMRVESGVASAVFSTGVNNDQWSVSSPQDARGFALMQYDGSDGSINLNTNGLGGFDLTQNGATAFRFEIESDLDTVYRFDVFCSAGSSFTDLDVPGQDGAQVQYEIPFSSFTGDCGGSFNSIGAMEILIEAFDNVDTIITEFVTVGPPNPSATPTPSSDPSPSNTPTPLPTQSNTPTGTPTPTRDPTSTSTPTPTPTCACYCPLFDCELLFATVGDDDNGYDDDNGDPDDDDDQNFSYGPYGNRIANPSRFDTVNYSSSSSASVLTVSAILTILVVAVLF